MVLANDVSLSGGILLDRNCTLDASSLDLLTNCGISEIDIEESNAPATQITQETVLPAMETELPPSEEEGGSSLSTEPVPPAPATDEALPELTVTVEPDATAANLVIEPTQETMQILNRKMILDALSREGVIHGIHEEKIVELMDQWCSLQRRYEINAVAEATAPVPGKQGEVRMTVRYLSIQEQCERIKNARYFWEVAESLPAVDHVRPGDVIGNREECSPSIPGKDVRGNPLSTDETIEYNITFEKGAAFDDRHESVLAECEGIAWHIGSVIGVLPIIFNGTFEVSIAPDEMTAFCKAHPAGPGGFMPNKEEILHQLEEHSVTFGIVHKDMETLEKLCKDGSCPVDPFIVAKGIPAIDGDDGTFNYQFDTDTSLSPKIDSEGHADYKSINIFTTVDNGDKLVSLIAPTAGNRGTTVTGKTVPAKPGNPVKLPQGPNTQISPENPDDLIAATAGIVRLSGGLVEVCEGYFVEGDVDFSTGNINYNKTVVVNGDIKAGFDVKCGGDLQVNGTVEESRISVGGNVLCRYGFVGQGKGRIKAKGDVNIGFIKNQKVKSFKNITIAKEAINCFLFSRESIHIHGSPLSIAGGEVTAKKEITVNTVGNHTGIRTLLQVGIDYLIVDELSMLRGQLQENEQQLPVFPG